MTNTIEIDLTDATIMMVDDEPINMEVVQAFLEDAGYQKFILVEKSVEAMNILEEKRPDVLLLDLIMPDVSGFDILSEIRSHFKLKHLPVIILTSSTDTETKLRALELGATDFLAKPVDPSELGLRLRNTLAAKAYIDQLAYYDPLTHLPKKELFLQRLEWSITSGTRYSEAFAILSIGLNNFNTVNATAGPAAGDNVLREISHRINNMIRSVDILTHSEHVDAEISFFRTEGSGFSLILNRIKSTDNAALVASRILEEMDKPFQVEDTELYLDTCIGVAMYPGDGTSKTSMLQAAVSARDYAKRTNSNRVQFASDEINSTYRQRMSFEASLRRSVEKDELVLYYQPKVDIKSGNITGVESLLRWDKGEEGLIPPDDFIPLAEETGIIIPMGEWVMHNACKTLKEWQQSDMAPISMSVNISAVQFDDPEFILNMKQIIDSSGIDTQYLTLEITESLLIDDVENKIRILDKFKDMGMKISLDDFGTGYSSFSYLRRLPVNELKIDRAFIKDLAVNSESQSIVSSMIYLSHSLGMLTVAEGVELKEQLHILQTEQCDQYQGFLFSRPVPADEISALLHSGEKRQYV